MIRKRKNPYHENLASIILSESEDYKFLAEGSYGEVYYFYVDNDIKIYDVFLKKGKYILKINWLDEIHNIERFNNLSKLGLIPKIYYNNGNITIMCYFEGMSFIKILKNRDMYTNAFIRKVLKNIIKEKNKWTDFDQYHGDLHANNIMVNEKGDVIFIDPSDDKNNKLIFRYLDLNDLDLSELDLSEAILRGADLSRADLSGTNLSGADLRGADFTDSIITSNTNFKNANIKEAISLVIKNPKNYEKKKSRKINKTTIGKTFTKTNKNRTKTIR